MKGHRKVDHSTSLTENQDMNEISLIKQKVDKIERNVEQLVELNHRILISQGGEKKTIERLQNDIDIYKNKISELVQGSDDVIFKLMKENERLRKRVKLYEIGDYENSDDDDASSKKSSFCSSGSSLPNNRNNNNENENQAFSLNQNIQVDNNIEYPKGYDPKRRRFSISSESYHPDQFKNTSLNNIPKSNEDIEKIRATIKENVLFKHLNENQLEIVANAMFEKQFKSGDIVIKQGDDGDCLYVVDSGELDVLYSGEKVATIGQGKVFGEIALMYNCPRTATIIANSDVELWGMDRSTFRRILMEESIRRRTLYQSFLEKVPLLESLYPYERAKVADALEPRGYKDGDIIIKQGSTDTDTFFIIEKGTVICTKEPEEDQDDLKPVEAIRLVEGDYFGELALLTNKPRQATVTALGDVQCLVISKKHFDQVMGPCSEILNRNTRTYESYSSLMQGGVQKKPVATDRKSVV